MCNFFGIPNKTFSGFREDSTRLPEYYDGAYEYLKSLEELRKYKFKRMLYG